MNKGDIKLVIDRLNNICDPLTDSDYRAIESAISVIETMGNQLAAQAAVIEKIKDELFAEYVINYSAHSANLKIEALYIPTDSKQILSDWINDVLGEPVGITDGHDFTRFCLIDDNEMLFKKPEIK